jgi:glutathione S-transferase
VSKLVIWTYDWVPKGVRGMVRDMRLRWACEEANLPYTIQSIPFKGRETNHLTQQPFGQVPHMSE